jgi:oxygen-dependent protoporphyrinogen oxidase
VAEQSFDVDVDVVVVGGGIAGLVAARHLSHLGHSVVVVEARDSLGGFVASHEVAGVRLDSGAESYATRKDTVATLIRELGLGDDIVTPLPGGAWVAWDGDVAPLPAAGILGIPGVPLADDVRRIIGWRGSLRAYADRLMPLLRVRAESDLGDIVRRRMGTRVLDRLVTPVVAGVHSADPSVVDVHTVAPGLTQAMTTQGSLSGAVMALREQAPAGSQVEGIAGGMFRLVEALEADCRFFGVQFRTGARVTSLEREALAEAPAEPKAPGAPVFPTASTVPDAAPASSWTVEIEPAPDSITGPDAPETLTARAVLVASGFRTGLALLENAGLGSAVPAADAWPEPASVTLATLVLDEPRLDARPRGTGVLVAPGTPGVRAKALTHSSAKWQWLADALPAHRHVLRLSYGRREGASGAGAVQAGSTAPVVDRATAVQDAATLLGVPLSGTDVAGFDVTTWHDSFAFATVGHKARVRQTLAAVVEVPGLDVVGAWVSGTGLAATVEHARITASGLAAELRGDRRTDRD